MSELSDIGVKSVSLKPQTSPKVVIVNPSQPMTPPVSPAILAPTPPAPNASQKFTKAVDSAVGFAFDSIVEAIQAGREFDEKFAEERAKRVRRQRKPSVRR